jgi:hypothetical protein
MITKYEYLTRSMLDEEIVRTTIALPAEVRRKAEAAAKAQRRSLSNYLLVLIDRDTKDVPDQPNEPAGIPTTP